MEVADAHNFGTNWLRGVVLKLDAERQGGEGVLRVSPAVLRARDERGAVADLLPALRVSQ